MGARSYDDEEYLPWYRQPTPTWLELSAGARGVLVSVAMTLNCRTGEVHLRKGLPSIATLIRLEWADIEPAVAELLDTGKLEWDEARLVLRDPEFLARQRTRPKSGAERMRELRERRARGGRTRDGCDASDERSSRDGCDDIRSDQIRSDPPKPPSDRRVSAGTALAVDVIETYRDAITSETKTPCALSGPGPRSDLLAAVEAHAPKDGAQSILDWVSREAIAWVRQHRGREQFTGGWAPKHFLGWLNGGKKPPAGAGPPAANGGASARARKDLTGYEP
jgi:hypothetical protein